MAENYDQWLARQPKETVGPEWQTWRQSMPTQQNAIQPMQTVQPTQATISQPTFNVQAPSTPNMKDVAMAIQQPPATPEIQNLIEGIPVQETGKQDIFRLEQGKLRYIPDMNTFNQLYGSSGSALIQQIAPETLTRFQQGEPIQAILGSIPAPNINNQLMSVQNYLTNWQSLQDATGITALKSEAKQQTGGLISKISSAISGLPEKMKGVKKTAKEEAGVIKVEEELGVIEQEIVAFEKNVALAKQDLAERPELKSTYAAQLNTLNARTAIEGQFLYAKLSAKQGSYDRAYKLASEAYDDAYKLELAQLEGWKWSLSEMQNMYKTQIDEQTVSNLNAMSYAIQQQQDQIQYEREQTNQKIQTMLSYPEAGIQPTDTWEVVQAKVAPFVETSQQKRVADLEADIYKAQALGQIDLANQLALQKANLAGDIQLADIKARATSGGGAPVLPGATITTDQLSPLAKSVYDGTISLTDITPTQRAQIAPELNAIGWTSAITSENKQDINFIKNQMGAITDLWKKIPGAYKGFLQGFVGKVLKTQIPEVAAFDNAVGIVGMQLTRLYEKGRISDEDRKFYLSRMPNLRMNEKTMMASADELVRLLEERLVKQTSELSKSQQGMTDENVSYLPGYGQTSSVSSYLKNLGY